MKFCALSLTEKFLGQYCKIYDLAAWAKSLTTVKDALTVLITGQSWIGKHLILKHMVT